MLLRFLPVRTCTYFLQYGIDPPELKIC